MNEVVFKTLKEKDFVVKNFLIKVVKELNLSLNETLLLIYFMNQEEPVLNIKNITSSIYLTEEEIMASFSRLVGINLISVSVIKQENGKRREIISLDNIIKQVSTDITKRHQQEKKSNIFEVFEKEFGRPLTSMEYEIINDWMIQGNSEELILEALKESIYNGVKSLRYISKIILSWQEKGYKNKNEVYASYKKETEENNVDNLFEYNWLEE